VDTTANDILVLDGLTEGQRAKFVRLVKGWRQIDLSHFAQCQPIDIVRLEHDRYVRPSRRKRILTALGLLAEECGKS